MAAAPPSHLHGKCPPARLWPASAFLAGEIAASTRPRKDSPTTAPSPPRRKCFGPDRLNKQGLRTSRR
eukprot:4678018-Alexandrium_andersonii.AAC.1